MNYLRDYLSRPARTGERLDVSDCEGHGLRVGQTVRPDGPRRDDYRWTVTGAELDHRDDWGPCGHVMVEDADGKPETFPAFRGGGRAWCPDLRIAEVAQS